MKKPPAYEAINALRNAPKRALYSPADAPPPSKRPPQKRLQEKVRTAGRSFYRSCHFAVLFTTIAEGSITFVLLTASPRLDTSG